MVRLVLLIVAAMALLGVGINKVDKHGLTVKGELQHHWTKPPTFWVDGIRIGVEDRPETQKWLEQQVGKQVEIIIR